MGSLGFAPQIPVVFVISVVSVIFATLALNPLVCGSLRCLRRFRDSGRFRERTGFQNIGLAKPRFRSTRLPKDLEGSVQRSALVFFSQGFPCFVCSRPSLTNLSKHSCVFPLSRPGHWEGNNTKIMRNGPKSPQLRLIATNRRLNGD